MGYFNATIAAALAGREVRHALLARFDFASGTRRFWAGFGDLLAGGEIWTGLGELGAISGLQAPAGGAAIQVTYTLSGVDPRLVAAAVGVPSEYKDRTNQILLQFFDEDWTTLDEPQSVHFGALDVMRVKCDGPDKRIIEVTSEGWFTRRAVIPYAYYSSAALRAKYPGAAGLDEVPFMENRTMVWPPF
jgi:hypothetical protein